MSAIIPLLIQYLPKIFTAVQLLGKVPEAIGTVGELKAFIDKVMGILKRPGMLTVEQRKALDEAIDKMGEQPHWKSEDETKA